MNPLFFVNNKNFMNDLVSVFKDFLMYLKKRSQSIIIFAAFGGLLGFSWAYFAKPMYTARTTFVFKDDNNSNLLAGLSGIGSLLGMGLSGTGASSMDRIVELSGSNLIVGKALLTSIQMQSRKDLLINHYLRLKEKKESHNWVTDSLLNQASFNSLATYETLNRSQRRALNEVIKELRGKDRTPQGTISVIYDKKSTIIELMIKDNNEEFALNLNKILYNELVLFYTNQATNILKIRVSMLQGKADSILTLLNATQSATAQNADQGLGLVLQTDRVRQKRLSIRENMLVVMYGETVKNLEQLNFLLTTTTPTFSIIDQSFSPIIPQRKSLLLYTTVCGIIFSLASLIINYVRFWRNRVLYA